MLAELLARSGPLALASQSPQRRAILDQLGLSFAAVVPDYDEVDPPGMPPDQLALMHARGKARSVPGDLVWAWTRSSTLRPIARQAGR